MKKKIQFAIKLFSCDHKRSCLKINPAEIFVSIEN